MKPLDHRVPATVATRRGGQASTRADRSGSSTRLQKYLRWSDWVSIVFRHGRQVGETDPPVEKATKVEHDLPRRVAKTKPRKLSGPIFQ
jgi:hypothetical protein